MMVVHSVVDVLHVTPRVCGLYEAAPTAYHIARQHVRRFLYVTESSPASSTWRGRISPRCLGFEASDNGKPVERLGRKATRLQRDTTRHCQSSRRTVFVGDAP